MSEEAHEFAEGDIGVAFVGTVMGIFSSLSMVDASLKLGGAGVFIIEHVTDEWEPL
jgi:hypothetical protein